jgi:F0F1-type ATP synthase gamma subunit
MLNVPILRTDLTYTRNQSSEQQPHAIDQSVLNSLNRAPANVWKVWKGLEEGSSSARTDQIKHHIHEDTTCRPHHRHYIIYTKQLNVNKNM